MSKKNRNLSELENSISDEYSLRIAELRFLREKVYPLNRLESKIYARVLILILYAHWEGFIKNISQYYIQYVHHQSLKGKELNHGFVTISQLEELKCFIESNVSLKVKIYKNILNNLEKKVNVPYDYVVSTYSNLNSKTLVEICSILGLDENKYSLKKGIIDQQLIKNRNDIAHGEIINIEPSDAIKIYDNIVNILTEFKNDVINYATMQKYLLINN